MSLSDQIQKDITEAMRARNEQRLSTLRMVKAALKNKEVDKRGPLDDKEALAVLSTLIKQRKESVEQYEKGNRAELAAKERREISIIESYLPKALSSHELSAIVDGVVRESGAGSLKDMGAVMKTVMARLAGQLVDGKQVSDLVRSKLQ